MLLRLLSLSCYHADVITVVRLTLASLLYETVFLVSGSPIAAGCVAGAAEIAERDQDHVPEVKAAGVGDVTPFLFRRG